MVNINESEYLSQKIADNFKACGLNISDEYEELAKWTIKVESAFYNNYGVIENDK